MTKRHQAPGKAHREGISLTQLMERFPDDESAERWFEQQVWPNGRYCPDCGSDNTAESAPSHHMPYRCADCKHYFSVRKATIMRSSKMGYRTWALALYLFLTNIKGISAMRLHRELDISYPSAWHLLHRLRGALEEGTLLPLVGDIELDETYIGGKNRNKHKNKRTRHYRKAKAMVLGAKARGSKNVRATVLLDANAFEMRYFVRSILSERGRVFTDQHHGYFGLPRRYSVNHSRGEYVRGDAHTQGIESFWAMLKRGYIGTYHWMSHKHLHRYVAEFAGRQNVRELGTAEQMSVLAQAMVGKRLRRADLLG